MTPTQRKAMDCLDRLEPFVHGLGSAILAELRAALAEQPAEQEPVYQHQMADESWVDIPEKCYQHNVQSGVTLLRVLYTAPQPAIPPGWADAYAAFKGAFDTPLARRKDDSEFAQDARRLLREFNDAMLATTEAPQSAKPAEQGPFKPDWVNYRQGLADGWEEGYEQGVADERTSEANIGIAGFSAKVNPARENPYKNTAPQPAKRVPLTREQVKEVMKPDYDTASLQERADFMTGFRAAERAHGIGVSE